MHDQKFHDDEVMMALLAAKESGTLAANRQASALAERFTRSGQLLDMCGGSILYLRVDGRSALGKQLRHIQHPDIKVIKEVRAGFVVFIRYPIEKIGNVSAQEMSISVAADTAAAEVLRTRLGIKAIVTPFID